MRITRYVLGLDIGGKSRNGLCLMDSEDLSIVSCSYIPFDSDTKYEHRRKIMKSIVDHICKVSHEDVSIVFEKINLYRGGYISHLYNIISLCRVQTTIINEFSELVDIYEVPVKSWKVRALKNGNADKDDSIRMVRELYPDVDLNVIIPHKRKADEIVQNHDLADSILIARACCIDPELLDDKNKLNFT